MPSTLTKTLIIRFSSVGDIALSTPLIRALRTRFPDSRIDYLVRSQYAELLRYHPGLSRLLEFPAGGTLRHLLALRRQIRKEHYDLVVDIHDSLRSRLLTLGHRNVTRVRKRKLARFVLVHFKQNLYRDAPPVPERYLETVRPLGVADDGRGLELFLAPDSAARAETALRASGIMPGEPFIALCPSARHANKIWPAERFAASSAAIARPQKAAIAILGGPGEQERCQEIARMIAALDPGLTVGVLAGRTSLLDSAAVMDRALLVLCNDTGLMHLAAARGCRIVALFGPTVREFGFFPYRTRSLVLERHGLYCRPCTHIGRPDCPETHFRCMRETSVEAVVDAARQLLTNPS